jgi:hypothetical protein
MTVRIQTLLAIGISLAFAGAAPLTAQPQWQVMKTFHIGGEGGWDYVSVDPPNHRIFVTRSTHTQAIDEETGKVLADIPGQERSHGVALVPRLGRGFITDGGGSGAILVFDLKTYQVLGKIATMPDSDGIIYDPSTNLVLAVSGDGGALMTFRPDIDPKNGKIDEPIKLDGAPEFLAVDGSGKAFINLEDKDVVAVVDLRTRKVVSRWHIAPGGHPVGMAIDAKAHQLFIGCRNPQKMIAMSTEDGKVKAALPIGAGVDATQVFAHESFASCRDGSLTVISEKAGNFHVEQTVKSASGARTMGLDPDTRKIFLPTAEMTTGANGQPTPKPGTFEIIVVGQP